MISWCFLARTGIPRGVVCEPGFRGVQPILTYVLDHDGWNNPNYLKRPMVFGITNLVPNTRDRISEVRDREKAAPGPCPSGEGRGERQSSKPRVWCQSRQGRTCGAGPATRSAEPDARR